MYYFNLHETTLFIRVQRLSELPCNHLLWPFKREAFDHFRSWWMCADVTWLSILISVSVSLSRNASTRACTPAPVMKLDSRFKLSKVLFSCSMSLNAWGEERGKKRKDAAVRREWSGQKPPRASLSLSLSPRQLGRYSALLPDWTFWRACSSPWLWRGPSA